MTFTHLENILMLCYVIFVIISICVILHDKGDPVKSTSWIVVIILLPVVGFLLYIYFGRNWRKKKIFSRKELKDYEQIEELVRQQLYELNKSSILQRPEIEEFRGMITLLLNNNKSLLTVKNRIKILNNGTATFDAIKESLRAAKSFIHLEYYIFADDQLGHEIADILIEKAREGVEVRFIYDDVGSWGLKKSFLKTLTDAGIEVKCFMRVRLPWLTSKVNYRNHRKILIVDGKVGYTGGINIAQRYISGTKKLGPWRDTHVKLEGESVAMLQVVFLTDWYFVSGKVLSNQERYLPRTDVEEEHMVQIAASGPDSDWASIMQMFFAAITHAKHHIYICSPYFTPNQAMLTAIKVASLSGVDVRIMIPSHSDSKIVYWASRSYIGELLDANVKVYLYRKGFHHSKLIMIDGTFSSVGTANMDMRSFEDNFEVSAIMYDREVTAELEQTFMDDLADSRFVTREYWETRPLLHSIYESFSRLFSPLL